MDHGKSSSESRAALMREEDRSLERALQLTRKSSLRRLSVEEMMSRAPDDWQPGEADVDDFLGSLRGGRDRA